MREVKLLLLFISGALPGRRLGRQNPLSMKKFLHFAKVFEQKIPKFPLNFFQTEILKIPPRKVPRFFTKFVTRKGRGQKSAT